MCQELLSAAGTIVSYKNDWMVNMGEKFLLLNDIQRYKTLRNRIYSKTI